MQEEADRNCDDANGNTDLFDRETVEADPEIVEIARGIVEKIGLWLIRIRIRMQVRPI